MVRWTGLLFMVGAALFALGVPLSLPHTWPPLLSAVIYATGAVFFTAAAALQLVLARRDLSEAARRSLPLRSRTSDWLAAAIQLLGTVLFNVNTIDAAHTIGAISVQASPAMHGLSTEPAASAKQVWTPTAEVC
jgi:hypothetical protein